MASSEATDEIKRTPASKNIWYAMMTVAGEPENGFEEETINQNRRYWNGWACAYLSEKDRSKIAGELGVEKSELAPLSGAEEETVLKRLQEIDSDRKQLPDPETDIDFSNTHFERMLIASKFVFPSKANFHNAQFSAWADFKGAQFSTWADFSSAQFSAWAYFEGAQFSAWAFFEGAQFSAWADFSSAQFSGGAGFSSAQFLDFVFFNDAKFLGETRFSNGLNDILNFQGFVPHFYGVEFHPDLDFATEKKNWPDVKTLVDHRSAKNAYTALRQHMNKLHKIDAEMFFNRQEMACQRRLEKNWFVRMFYGDFEFFSDYGWSLSRPLWGLILLWFFGAVSYFLAKGSSLALSSLLSASSVFPSFGMRRNLLESYEKGAGESLEIFAMTMSMGQTFFGLFFLFFFGLALRNRFRLR